MSTPLDQNRTRSQLLDYALCRHKHHHAHFRFGHPIQTLGAWCFEPFLRRSGVLCRLPPFSTKRTHSKILGCNRAQANCLSVLRDNQYPKCFVQHIVEELRTSLAPTTVQLIQTGKGSPLLSVYIVLEKSKIKLTTTVETDLHFL